VDLLHLLRSGRLASADRPHRLVGEDHLRPVVHNPLDGVQLPLDDLDGPVLLPFLQRLSEAEDDLDVVLERALHLLGDHLVRLPEVRPPLRVAQDHPRHLDVLQVLRSHLSSESAESRRTVLGGHLDELVLFGEDDSD
jgi:hypothetical protein